MKVGFIGLGNVGGKLAGSVLRNGHLGSASILKVVTNYLATANLLSLCEALVTSKLVGMDLNTAYEAIRIRAPGFPGEMFDDEPEQTGYEVVPVR